ncbi:Hypothetical protein MAGa4060 [Mycoplasmopsis agalactiae]|uniref:Uncharacterized protein n=1 Tax=Mycoplasmopsis agalactiae TaxID=2110 RepID=D3VQM4_MYCAA|nr:Hypothetical protein MAGa4060 [Mycoplasmopsis agalactiae]
MQKLNCAICIKRLKLMFFNLDIETNLTLVLIVLWMLVIPEHFSYLKFFKCLYSIFGLLLKVVKLMLNLVLYFWFS